MRSSPLLLLLSLSLPAGALMAQAPAPAPATPQAEAARAPTLTPAQQAQQAKQDADMSQAALKVAEMVDGNRAAEVWDGASAVARKAVARDAFASHVATDRGRLGALVSRGQASVTRVQYPAGAPVPEGLYINVSFPTRFANDPQPVRELVSFRLDEDRVWRVSGYSVRAATH